MIKLRKTGLALTAGLIIGLLASWISPATASAQQVGIMGEIRLFAGNFAPQGWFFCDGRTLDIVQYQALFSILGCNYGGDYRTKFNLPDLRSRTAMGFGTGSGLSTRNLGDKIGHEQAGINAKNQGQQLNVAPAATGHSGNSLASMPPALTLNYIICWQGYYPERN